MGDKSTEDSSNVALVDNGDTVMAPVAASKGMFTIVAWLIKVLAKYIFVCYVYWFGECKTRLEITCDHSYTRRGWHA